MFMVSNNNFATFRVPVQVCYVTWTSLAYSSPSTSSNAVDIHKIIMRTYSQKFPVWGEKQQAKQWDERTTTAPNAKPTVTLPGENFISEMASFLSLYATTFSRDTESKMSKLPSFWPRAIVEPSGEYATARPPFLSFLTYREEAKRGTTLH